MKQRNVGSVFPLSARIAENVTAYGVKKKDYNMLSIKVPKELEFGVHKYKVIYQPNLGLDSAVYGMVYHRKLLVEIDPALSKPDKDITLFHEIFHIIDKKYNCELSDENIDRMANGLADFMQRNFGIEFDWVDIRGE